MIPYKDIPTFNHERLLSKIIINANNCWVVNLKMKKVKGNETYPIFTINKKEYLVHRVSFSVFNQLSNLLVIDHMCRNKCCINPDHLRQVTQKTNALENNVSIMALNKLKTHCKHGHEFNIENTRICKNSQNRPNLIRRCIICDKAKDTKRNLKSKEIRNGKKS